MKRALAAALLACATASFACKTLRLAGPPPLPVSAERPSLQPGQIAVTWLGNAGALVRGHDRTVAFDPYVSRHNLARSLFGNLRPDTAAIDRFIPHVDLVLIGHAHADHIVDAPYLVTRDQADLVGSLTSVQVARGYGAPLERLHVVGPGERVDIRGVSVSAERGGHVTLLGRIPGRGIATELHPAPLRGDQFRTGGPRLWRVVVDGVRIGHLSSGALPANLPADLSVDVLFLSVAQMKAGVLERLLPLTRPRFVVPIHQDVFFLGLEETPRPMPGFNEDQFVADVAKLAPEAYVVSVRPMQEHVLDIRTGQVR